MELNYIYVHPFAMEKWNNNSSHEITIIKENINLVFIKIINLSIITLMKKN
jgi:hypothetical protein